MQSGAGVFAFVALLLLALPDVFTFHTLFALPRLADRRRTFWVQPTSLCLRLEPFSITVVPCAYFVPNVQRLFHPINGAPRFKMKKRFCYIDICGKSIA